MELLDEVMLKAVNQYASRNYKETPTLFFEFSGSQASIEEQLKQVAAITQQNNGGKLKFALDDQGELFP